MLFKFSLLTSFPFFSFLQEVNNENDQIQFNKEKGYAKPKVVEGKEYDPIFMATQVLKDELQKIVK